MVAVDKCSRRLLVSSLPDYPSCRSQPILATSNILSQCLSCPSCPATWEIVLLPKKQVLLHVGLILSDARERAYPLSSATFSMGRNSDNDAVIYSTRSLSSDAHRLEKENISLSTSCLSNGMYFCYYVNPVLTPDYSLLLGTDCKQPPGGSPAGSDATFVGFSPAVKPNVDLHAIVRDNFCATSDGRT